MSKFNSDDFRRSVSALIHPPLLGVGGGGGSISIPPPPTIPANALIDSTTSDPLVDSTTLDYLVES